MHLIFMANLPHLRPRNAKLPPTLDAFRHRGFRLLWPANFFSYISRWMQMTLLVWLVLELTGSPFLVALVGFFGMIPLLLFGAIGGVLADRIDRRKLLRFTQLLNLAAGLAMLFLLISGTEEYWHSYVVVLVSGLGWAFDMPARRSIVLDVTGRVGVTNAMALDSVGMHASRMIGPALAGILIQIVGLIGGYVVIVALYVVSLGFLTVLRLPPRELVQTSHSVIRNLAEGFVYVRSNRVILGTVIVTVLMNLLLFPYMQMVPVIARDTLNVGAGLMGILMGADGLGAIIGSIAIASFGQLRYHGRVYLGGSLIGLVLVLAFAASQWFAVSLPVLILLGLGTAGFGTMQSTIIVISASDDMRGRALGVISLAIGAGPIGALLIGAVAETTSPATGITIFAILGILSLSLVALLMPELRAPMYQQPPAGDNSAQAQVSSGEALEVPVDSRAERSSEPV